MTPEELQKPAEEELNTGSPCSHCQSKQHEALFNPSLKLLGWGKSSKSNVTWRMWTQVPDKSKK